MQVCITGRLRSLAHTIESLMERVIHANDWRAQVHVYAAVEWNPRPEGEEALGHKSLTSLGSLLIWARSWHVRDERRAWANRTESMHAVSVVSRLKNSLRSRCKSAFDVHLFSSLSAERPFSPFGVQGTGGACGWRGPLLSRSSAAAASCFAIVSLVQLCWLVLWSVVYLLESFPVHMYYLTMV